MIKIADLEEECTQQGVIFALAFLKAYQQLFGNYSGCRESTIHDCFSWLQENLHESIRGVDYAGMSVLWSFRRHTVFKEFIGRFDISGFEAQINTLAKLTTKWIISHEMQKVTKSIIELKKRSRLRVFGKKYPELKRALGKL